MAFDDATTFIRDRGTFLIDTLETIPPEITAAITRSVANLFSILYAGILDVVATRNSDNQISTDALSYVLPHSLLAISH